MVDISEENAGYEYVSKPFLYNSEGGDGPRRDDIIQGDPNSHVDSSIGVQHNGIGFQHKLINGEGLTNGHAEAVLQNPGLNLATVARPSRERGKTGNFMC
jgi:hypothetical protein